MAEIISSNGSGPMGAIPVDWQGLSSLIAQLMTQAEQIGRLRAERDALMIERNRLLKWIETDRAFTDKLVTSLEAEVGTLREEVKIARAAVPAVTTAPPTPAAPPETAAPTVPVSPPEHSLNGNGASEPRPRTYGIGRRRREGMDSRYE